MLFSHQHFNMQCNYSNVYAHNNRFLENLINPKNELKILVNIGKFTYGITYANIV